MNCRLLLFLILAGTLDSVTAADSRPNILFFFADDWGRYASIYTSIESRPSFNQVVRTPNIDAVARRGALFRNAFVGSPSCTPCRSALLSGRYFFGTGRGAILQGAQWDASIPAWPLLLRDSGYHIGKTAKVWSPGTPADAPYGGQQYAYEKAGTQFNRFSTVATKMVADGATVAEAKEKLIAQARGNFEQFLAAKAKEQPFCYWFGPTLTHRSWQKGSGKALWGIEPESLKGKLPAFLPDVPEVREDVADYLGEAQAWDALVGTLLKTLVASGELGNTLIFISGDHGMPGVPHGKCNLYDFGVGVALIAAGPGIKPGRVVDDFVWLPDLAATFLEVGGVKLPSGMNARSLVPVLHSEKSGQVDPTRSWVVTGRERHVASAREGNLPYPQRALRTGDFLYIRNFAPDRWPMGAPKAVTDDAAPSGGDLANNTFVAFADMDSSPTKAWLVEHRGDTEWKQYYEMAFAKRGAEELYDLRQDPDQVRNVASDPAYAAQKKRLAEQLMKTLRDAGDPRVTGAGDTFDKPPFSDPVEQP
ncbi:MAG: sulfatase, partial [Verrucomicrobia bacterium]|nr:sulfatase [Verrucomicrobiota bacterium]